MSARPLPNAAHLEYVLRIADTSLILGQRAVGVVRSRSGDRGRHRADERRARSDRSGAPAADHMRRNWRAKGRDEDQTRLPAHRAAVPQPDDRRTSERRLRPHDPAQLPRRCVAARAVAEAGRLERQRARRDRGQEPEGDALPPAARGRLDRAPGRRHRRIACPHAACARHSLAVHGRVLQCHRRGHGRRSGNDRTGLVRHSSRRGTQPSDRCSKSRR